jgi:cob(I)alamin adenosyltransferase
MRIYTKTGDDGSTGLYGGSRVSKSDPRVEAYGGVDEANAAIGFARAAALPPAVDEVLARAQVSLFDVGARLASPPAKRASLPVVSEADVVALERAIDALEATLPPLKSFVLPGGCEGAARLHLARTTLRRAERHVVALSEASPQDPVEPVLLRYLNRLSDLLFVQARATNAAAGVPDVPWAPRAAK